MRLSSKQSPLSYVSAFSENCARFLASPLPKNFQTISDGTQGVIRITLKYVQPGKENHLDASRLRRKGIAG